MGIHLDETFSKESAIVLKDSNSKKGDKKNKLKKSNKKLLKKCNTNQIRNPNTNRCVKKTSQLGKNILSGNVKKKSSRYVSKYADLPVGSIIKVKNGRCMEKRPNGRMVFTRLKKSEC